MPYRHIWTDEGGVNRQDRCRMSNFAFANISEGAAPSRIGSPGGPARRVVVLVLPDKQGRRGHRSGTVGDRPAVLMLVQVARRSSPGRPCLPG